MPECYSHPASESLSFVITPELASAVRYSVVEATAAMFSMQPQKTAKIDFGARIGSAKAGYRF